MLQLEPEERQRMIKEIQGFFREERDEELGLVAAEVILDFFLEGLGKVAYNKGLDESRKWFSRVMSDMEYGFEELYKL